MFLIENQYLHKKSNFNFQLRNYVENISLRCWPFMIAESGYAEQFEQLSKQILLPRRRKVKK